MATSSISILLTNLGTPDAPTRTALRRYLKEFLWDKRVVDLPRPLWWLILNLVILTFRPLKSARLYQKVWTENGSPLLHISLRQRQGLEAILQQRHGAQVQVALAMRYGNPSIARGLRELRNAGCRRVLVLPLYPQYSSASTASTFDALALALEKSRDMPEIRFVRDYHDYPGYIDALAASIREAWKAGGKPDKLLMSFHGIPARFRETGDPYPAECRKTATLLAARLGLDEHQWQFSFQSRFGREQWIQPHTDKALVNFAKNGVRHVDVVCPGFSADCLETLEEIAIRNRHFFLDAGGEKFRYIPALNDREEHLQVLADIVDRHCSGWLENSNA